MENNKKKLLLPIITIAIFLVTMIGASFAYFASRYVQNGNKQTIDIRTESVTNITYFPGSAISFENLDLPVSSKGTYVKASEGTFSINATGSNVEDTVSYDLNIVVSTNTFKEAIGKGTTGNIMCKLFRTDIDNGTYSQVGKNINCDDSTNLALKEKLYTILNNDIASGNVFYRLEVYVWNSEEFDNSASGKSYSATLKLTNVDSEKFPIRND